MSVFVGMFLFFNKGGNYNFLSFFCAFTVMVVAVIILMMMMIYFFMRMYRVRAIYGVSKANPSRGNY